MPEPKLTIERLTEAGLGAFFRPRDAERALGLTYARLRALEARGEVERVSRGLYRLASAEPTEHYSVAMACARVPESIVCLLTALRVHDLGTQVPAAVWLGIPHKAQDPILPALRLRIVRFSGAAWTYGIQETEFEGVRARITSPERTVLDCFRYHRLLGAEPALEALEDGLRRKILRRDALERALEVLPSRRLAAALDARSI